MIKASEFESQVIYFCKFWFEMPNTNEEIIEGIKIIIGKYYALEPKWVTDYDVYRNLLNMSFKFVPQGLFKERLLNLFKYQGDMIDIKHFIKQMYGEIQGLQINNDDHTVLIELTEPDYSVLAERTTPIFLNKIKL